MRHLRLLVPLALVLVACAAPPPPGSGGDEVPPADAGSTPAGCESTLLCYPGCPDNDPTCVKGTLDPVACACVSSDGTSTPLPTTGGSSDAGTTGGGTTDGGSAATSVQSVELTPAPPAKLGVGDLLDFKVIAHLTTGAAQDVTATAQVDVAPADAFEKVSAGHYRATQPGHVTFTAHAGAKTASADTQVLRVEARAVWITRFGFKTADDVRRLINTAADNHFNVVFFQIRGNGDAYYKSTLEPWAQSLAGQLGKDPGWDPLKVAVDTAHARGLQLHAYFNAFTGWPAGQTVPDSVAGAPKHPLKAHPEWLEVNAAGQPETSEYAWMSPGVAAVRDHNAAVIREILTKYEVDGIHLDRIRYSGNTMGYNALARQAYAAQYGTDESHFTQWRTENVNQMVRAAYQAILDVRPTAKLSASVWGIHTRLPNCTTSQGLTDYFQDSWAWAQGGYIDALAPMIYWAEGSGCTDYGDLLKTFLDHKGTRMIWGGMHVLDKGTTCSGNCAFDWNKLSLRIDTARGESADGVVFFASNYLDDSKVWPMLGSGPFHDEALVPKGKR